MRKCTTYNLLVLLLLAICLPSCDFLETSEDQSGFPWTGNWEVTSAPEGTPSGATLYLNVSSLEYTGVGVFDNECFIAGSRVTDIRDVEPEGDSVSEVLDLDGDIVTVQFEEGSGESRFQADTQRLLITIISSPVSGENPDDQLRGQAINFDPRNLDVCSDANIVSKSSLISLFTEEQ